MPTPTERCDCGNWARPGHATCNECRPAEEKKAEREKLAALRKEQDEEDAKEQRVIDALPDHSKCPCGAFARRWKDFRWFEFCNGEEEFEDTVESYKAFLEKVKEDPLCGDCNSKRTRASSA